MAGEPVLWCSDSTPCDKKLTRCCSVATWLLPGAPLRLCSAAVLNQITVSFKKKVIILLWVQTAGWLLKRCEVSRLEWFLLIFHRNPDRRVTWLPLPLILHSARRSLLCCFFVCFPLLLSSAIVSYFSISPLLYEAFRLCPIPFTLMPLYANTFTISNMNNSCPIRNVSHLIILYKHFFFRPSTLSQWLPPWILA